MQQLPPPGLSGTKKGVLPIGPNRSENAGLRLREYDD